MGYLALFLSVIGGAAGGLLIVWGLGKRLLDIQVSRVTEKFKSELEQKSSILKTELSIYAHEQNVGISRLDQQRSDAICLIFGHITKWHTILMEITKPHQPKWPNVLLVRKYAGSARELVDAAEAISVALHSNAIFFNDTSHGLIGDFGIEAIELSCDFYDKIHEIAGFPLRPEVSGEEFMLIEQGREALYLKVIGEFDETRKQLMQELRVLLKAER